MFGMHVLQRKLLAEQCNVKCNGDEVCLGLPVRAVGKPARRAGSGWSTFRIRLTISRVSCQILPHIYDQAQRKYEWHGFIARQRKDGEMAR